MFVPEDALCSSPATLSIYSVHGGEVGADDPLCSFDDQLQQFPLSQGGVDQAKDSRVIHLLNDDVIVLFGGTVICVQ